MYMIQIKWGTKSLRYLKESNNGGGGAESGWPQMKIK